MKTSVLIILATLILSVSAPMAAASRTTAQLLDIQYYPFQIFTSHGLPCNIPSACPSGYYNNLYGGHINQSIPFSGYLFFYGWETMSTFGNLSLIGPDGVAHTLTTSPPQNGYQCGGSIVASRSQCSTSYNQVFYESFNTTITASHDWISVYHFRAYGSLIPPQGSQYSDDTIFVFNLGK